MIGTPESNLVVEVADLRIGSSHAGAGGPGLLRAGPSGLEAVADSRAGRRPASRGLDGVVLPAFVDAHVHLALVDPRALRSGGVGAVVDLGSDPGLVRALATEAREDLSLPDIAYAGAFLTAPRGYPTDREWAEPTSVREIADEAAAVAGVDEMRAAGASRIKVALNAEAGPVLSDEVLRAIVHRAHRHGLPIVAHAQGAGQPERASAAGVDELAHTPWTHRIDDEAVARMAERMTWTSTLDIHGYGAVSAARSVAVDNLGRFAAAGGRVRYGTDQGNGPLPMGIDTRELAALVDAGIGVEGLLEAVRAPATEGSSVAVHRRLAFVPGPVPSDADAAVRWLSGARVLTTQSIEEFLT